VTIPSIISVEN